MRSIPFTVRNAILGVLMASVGMLTSCQTIGSHTLGAAAGSLKQSIVEPFRTIDDTAFTLSKSAETMVNRRVIPVSAALGKTRSLTSGLQDNGPAQQSRTAGRTHPGTYQERNQFQ